MSTAAVTILRQPLPNLMRGDKTMQNDIGERIRRLRNEKMMTQAELAGNEITRNMLSRIENGAVNPSLSTIQYLAHRLNVPAGYLLADDRDEMLYRKSAEMTNIKNAFVSGNLKICRDMCRRLATVRDDEINLIAAECALGLGIERFDNGDLHGACTYLDEAIHTCGRTIYHTAHIRSVAATYFRYIRMLSPMLGSDIIEENDVEYDSALWHDFSRYVIAYEYLQNGEEERALELISGIRSENPMSLHIHAVLDMRKGNYDAAYERLHRILTNSYAISEPQMYFVFCDLEITCREREDFKGAYEYSHDKMALLEKLLRE